jgi:predicted transcriptional regulator
MTSATMTIRVPTETRDKLDRLAQGTRRSRSYLAAEAVAAYVERELSIIEGIQQGLADVAAGRTVPHDVAMREIDAIIANAKAARG